MLGFFYAPPSKPIFFKMLDEFKKEYFIRRTLRKIARQRVAMILEPNNIWVIEKALVSNEKIEAAIATCLMRGWIEILDKSIPIGRLTSDGKLPNKPLNEIFKEVGNIYRITDSGWSVINRQKLQIILSLFVATLTLIFMIFL